MTLETLNFTSSDLKRRKLGRGPGIPSEELESRVDRVMRALANVTWVRSWAVIISCPSTLTCSDE